MKKIQFVFLAITILAIGSSVQAGEITLLFNPNDIFISAMEDDTRLNQQGEARRVWDTPTGRYYLTYNDSARDPGPPPAFPEEDIESIGNILGWEGCWAGYQGVSHIQLWLRGGAGVNWGEQVVRTAFTSASVNGEFDWTADVSSGYVHYNTVLGGEGHQNAISLCYKPAETLWTVTGDLYFDENSNGAYDDTIDTEIMVGGQYTLWFNAAVNNWRCVDAYGNDAWGSPDIEGTVIGIALPEALAEEISDCAMAAKNHGHFVSCVNHVTLAAKRAGVVSPKEKGAISSWAAQSNIP